MSNPLPSGLNPISVPEHGEVYARDCVGQPVECLVPQHPVARHLLVRLQVARADDDICLIAQNGAEEEGDLLGPMLPIAVNQDHRRGA